MLQFKSDRLQGRQCEFGEPAVLRTADTPQAREAPILDVVECFNSRADRLHEGSVNSENPRSGGPRHNKSPARKGRVGVHANRIVLARRQAGVAASHPLAAMQAIYLLADSEAPAF